MHQHAHYSKPLPRLLPETAGYWQACQRHKLVIQQCATCGGRQYFPRLICHRCLSDDLIWSPAIGNGKVYTFTIVRQVLHKSFASEVPYVYAIIELEEGVRVIANLKNIEPALVQIGLSVKPVFNDVTPEWSLLQFEPR